MIDAGISLHPIFPLWAIITLAFGLLVFMVWKEWQRKIRYRYARVAAVVLIIISILGLLLQPSVERERESNGVVLLTPHYKATVADSLLDANPMLTLLRTDEATPYREAAVLERFDDLYQNTNLHFVVGDGLPPYVLSEIEKPFQFFKGALPDGIVAWSPPSNFKLNRMQEIQATFRANGKSKIKLVGPGGVEDSVSFSQQGTYDFTLSLTPKQSGLFSYSLVIEEKDKTQTQRFPVEVVQEKKLNVLFVQSYPTAETRYLKNFLSEQDHSIVVRSKISKDKFRYEYANREPLRIDRLSPEILNEFDLFFIDPESLEALSSNENKILEESVKQGLGLLTFYNSKEKFKSSAFLSLSMRDFAGDTVRLNLGSLGYTLPTLPLEVSDYWVEPITQGRNRILSGYVNKGAGRLAFQLLQETYRLLLEGRKMEYASLWSPLVERTARTQNSKFKIKMEQPFPIYPDEPLNVNVIAAAATPQLTTNGALIPLREDVVIDDYWHGTTWAAETGWHNFAIAQDSTSKNIYVSNPDEWKSLRIVLQQKANEAVSQKAEQGNDDLQWIKERKPISLLVFYLIFLIAAGFLWLAPKL